MTSEKSSSFISILLIFLRLGLTSFGGPVAHIGYFREEFVNRRQWLSEQSYADLVALCQFLPGPASSQVGLALGLSRGGFMGALAAWCGFTLPSALVLVLVAYGVMSPESGLTDNVIHALKLVAVAVVVQAVWGMAQAMCRGRKEITLTLMSACALLLIPSVWLQPLILLLSGCAGVLLFQTRLPDDQSHLPVTLSPRIGTGLLAAFFILLLGLPALSTWMPLPVLGLFDLFYRAGSLVFGGGHVVLPLLEAETVLPGHVSEDLFLAGYGAAQAVPGPLFTFAAYLGTAMDSLPGWLGGLTALVAIFMPSFLLVAGVLPFWSQLSPNRPIRSALTGINAAVVGLLLAALYDPIWTSTVHSPVDFALVLLAFVALQVWRLPVWLLVPLFALGGLTI
ncbi:chromate efflux transporter [Marinobacterium sediminicola]|uniref:Chromate transporter n=1 Tax=Marinobacterium sediminicola TaxID=518898 RepID=A0ABY1RW43_9GAMM|nr:chromate efflux transporter [Marinobacterium sediminicola]ULG70430.1 chromate efflux transporter [Marinobacterium sediminicola]SMR69369.1 chromate transporter [Marinobacterium sediminicola]